MTGRRTIRSLAGPFLFVGGLLVVGSQIAVWPLPRDQIIDTLTSPVYGIAMTAYLIGLWMLIIGVFGLHQWQAREAGTFGLIALVAVVVGTANMAGNAWFDTFVGPWLARRAPAALEVARDGSLVAGALSSYISVASGWVLMGVACLRARVVPRPLALALIPAGLLAFFPVPPYSIGFGAIVLALGVWLTRHRSDPVGSGRIALASTERP